MARMRVVARRSCTPITAAFYLDGLGWDRKGTHDSGYTQPMKHPAIALHLPSPFTHKQVDK